MDEASTKKRGVKVMPAFFNVQHVVHKLLVVSIAVCQIDLVGIDDQQMSGFVVKKEPLYTSLSCSR